MPNKIKIVLLEDESLVALELANTLTSLGYEVVDYVTNTTSLLKVLEEKSVDLLIMDINLGTAQDSIDFYTTQKLLLPLIYITAYSDEATIEKAIRTNPLGYLLKPINENELKALLKLAEYKLHSVEAEEITQALNLGYGYSFDTQKRKLFYNQIHINLGTKELLLLELLIKANGQAISFETIEESLYKDNAAGTSSLRTLIYRLRTKLEHKLIQNEFNYGIKLPRVSHGM
jgi:DNA-binding response OmpR family regulator